MLNFCAKRAMGFILVFGLVFLRLTHCYAEPAQTWSGLDLEKRCEGLLEFLRAKSAAELPDWTMIKPQCVIAGDSNGEVSWSLEASWKKGAKALPLRYTVTEIRSQKPKTSWCVVKAKKSACAAPWENEFSQGKLFTKKEDGRSAYQAVLKLSQGFMVLATRLDEWVGKGKDQIRVYDSLYSDFVKAWASSPRSLPVKKDVFVAEYALDRDSTTSGQVNFKDELPEALRTCFGCAKTPCNKSPISFTFSGLSLLMSRDLTPEEQQVSTVKTAQVSWLIMEPTPFLAGEPKWPFLCGEHRFVIQKM